MAGSYVSIATIGGSVSVTKLNDLQTQLTNTKTILESQDPTQIQNLNREHIMGDMFYAGTLGYFAQYTALTHVSGLQQGAHQGLLPSVGTYGYVPKVNYLFGFPNAIEPGGIEMDLDSVSTFTGLDTYDKETLKAFVQQTGTLSSALEHAVPEQMFTSPENPGEAVSAIKALALANAQGQRTYHITQANQLTALPNIHHDAATLSEIQSALAVGKEVITHTAAITLNGWTGAGYIILDPDTGSGAYKISGGSNGSFGELFLEGYGGLISNIISIGLAIIGLLTLLATPPFVFTLLPVLITAISLFHLYINLLNVDLELNSQNCPDGLRAINPGLGVGMFVLRRLVGGTAFVSSITSFLSSNTVQAVSSRCARN